MVFANLGTNEKDALFTLLDEYFASRPEIFQAVKGGNSSPSVSSSNPFRKEVTGPQAQAAAAAVGRFGDAAGKFVSAGLKNAQNATANARATHGSGGGGGGASAPSTTAGQDTEDSESMDTRSGGSLKERMAALQSGKGSIGGSPHNTGVSASNLATVRKFGDVDMSSGKGFYNSPRFPSSNPPKPSNAVDNTSSAFPPKNTANRFGPPPTRASASPAPPPPPPPRQPEPEPEEEQGEWVEALYDYETTEAGDLPFSEGQNILVIEKTSDDWWTGELDGKKGLFPVSYVKPL